jgi:hypothetical protein
MFGTKFGLSNFNRFIQVVFFYYCKESFTTVSIIVQSNWKSNKNKNVHYQNQNLYQILKNEF